MAVKVFKDRKSAKKELIIARDICQSNLKGLAILEDDGKISRPSIARKLGVPLFSVFIVYRYLGEENIKDVFIKSILSKRDII